MSLKYRPMAVIGFTILTVLLICIYAYENFAIVSIALGTVLLVAALAFKRIREQIFPFFLASALVLSGALYFISDVRSINSNAYVGNEYTLSGRLCDEGSYSDSRYYYTLDNVQLDGNEINSKLKLSLPETVNAEIYDYIEINSVKTYLVGKTSSTAKMYYNSNGIYIGAYASQEETYTVKITECENKPLGYYFKKANHTLTERVLEKIPNENGAIAVAMLTGNKDYMSTQTVDMYTNAGIAPLFAVSGFHLSVWIMGLYEILRSFGVKKRTNSAVAIVTTLCYMALTGFSASVCRAGIMMIIMLGGNLFYRRADSINSLGIAAIIMCLLNPLNASSIGFLLSVTATLGIVVLCPLADKYIFSRLPNNVFFAIFKSVLSVVFVCIAAVIGAMPATILFIGQFSVMSVFSNLAVSFVAGFCMFFGGLTAVLYPLGVLGNISAFLCEYTAKYIYNVIDFVYSLNVPLVPTSDIYWHAGAILCVTVIISSMFISRELRNKITAVALSAVIAVCGVLSYLHYDGLTQVDILSAESSILIVASDSSGKIVLCDETGYEYYADDALDKLDSLSKKDAELLLIPTFEASVNSKVLSLIEQYDFENIVTPFASQEINRLADGTIYNKNNISVDVLNSGTVNYLNGDGYSVALCCFDTVRILVIFDSNRKSEIPEDYLEADVLICSGTLPYCVDVAQYNEVIASASESMSAKIKETANNCGVAALTTAENGNIRIEIKNQDYKIKENV